jgi:hypothetical protein
MTLLQTVALALSRTRRFDRMPLWVVDATILMLSLSLLVVFAMPLRVLYGPALANPDKHENVIATYNKLVFFGVLYVVCGFMRCVWSLPLGIAVSIVAPRSSHRCRAPSRWRTRCAR